MKPVFENISNEEELTIMAGKFKLPYFNAPFHYHPRYEIVYITESEGTMFVGDKKFSFSPGELTFIGPSIPHTWVNSRDYYNNDDKTASAYVIQFKKELFSESNLKSYGFHRFANLLHNSGRCIQYKNINNQSLDLLDKICKSGDEIRYISLLELFINLDAISQYSLLFEVHEVVNKQANNKLDKLLSYIYNNSCDITLEMASDYLCMNKSALCRYVKSMTNNTFSELVNQIRLKNACILLRDTDLNIRQIAFEAGYSSVSYFMRLFKRKMGISPGTWRNNYIDQRNFKTI